MSGTKVGVSDLSAHLSQYLARVRRGEHIVVYDRKTPIAVIEAYEESPRGLHVRPAIRRIADVIGRPVIPVLKPTDAVAMLLEDREER